MSESNWKHDGVRVIPAGSLDPNTAINASRDETLECILVRSDGEAVAGDLDIEPAEKPEAVAWVDPTHPAP